MRQSLEGHTHQSYDGELNHLHVLAVEMGGLVIDQTRAALGALEDQDVDAARRILDREREVNDLERRIDEEVVALIARRSPVARDLRVVISISKMVTDFERIGDEASKVAKQVGALYGPSASSPSEELVRDVPGMGRLVLGMLRDALAAFDELDGARAEALAFEHTELDAEFRSCLRRLTTFVLEDPRTIGHLVSIVLMVKALERIGDHARNVAEDVVFIVQGEDVRHRPSDLKARGQDRRRSDGNLA
jgi:phosphate transport system protein